MTERKKLELIVNSDHPLFRTRLLYYLIALAKNQNSALAIQAQKKMLDLSFSLGDAQHLIEPNPPIIISARYNQQVQDVAQIRRYDQLHHSITYQENIEIHHTVLEALVGAAIVRYLIDFNYLPKAKTYTYADVTLDQNKPEQLFFQDKAIPLQPKEHQFLLLLMKQPLKQLTHEGISEWLNKNQPGKDRRYISTLVSQLNKIFTAQRINIRIKVIRNYGYRIAVVKQD
jgi:hypothetical protein